MPEELHQLLDRVLDAAVLAITGDPEAAPRPGQVRLAHDILDRMLAGDGRLAGVAPTGLGKSAALLAPSLLMAATRKQRSVISTESKALQSQYAGKDYPVLADAVQEVTGVRPALVVHKGFRNFACLSRALGSVAALSGWESVTLADSIGILEKEAQQQGPFYPTTVQVDGRDLDRKALARLCRWVLFDGVGDRSLYPPGCTDDEWAAVSCDSSDCIVDQVPDDPDCTDCPFFAECPAQQSRTAAGEADVIVTNHTLLGMQAALAIPTVLSSRRLGRFHHLLLDEAHALPDEVRKAGGGEITAMTFRGLAVLPKRFRPETPALRQLAQEGRQLADRVHELLIGHLPERERKAGGEVPFDPEHHPLEPIVGELIAWMGKVGLAIPAEDVTGHIPTRVRIRQARGRLERVAKDLAASADTEAPYVRSVSAFTSKRDGQQQAALKFSPVWVAPLIEQNLCQVNLPETKDEFKRRKAAGNPPPTAPISVSAVSGTLPEGFPAESGLNVPLGEYESPFDAAYGGSMLYAPLLRDDELGQAFDRRGSRWTLNPARHAAWCQGKIVEAVGANQGSALVLAATVANGQGYAAALRAANPAWRVLSQWDGRDVRSVVEEWRHDPTSVLVGTRSLMTGVDGQGDTCTLVIVDRPPRAVPNLVDDARAEAYRKQKRASTWDADRAIYVGDAALLLEQAAGRLIRGISDGGLVMCLDPRLTNSPAGYPKATKLSYQHAFRRFKVRTVEWEAALGFLGEQAAARKAA